MREATIICRRSSRHGLRYYERLCRELPKRGFAIVESQVVGPRLQLKKRIREAVKSGRHLIVVVGGDGTQTAAVGELAYSSSVLAVVPAGTGNSFALSLGIHNDIDESIETIVSGKELCVDLGRVNGTYFANIASIGLIAQAANVTPNPLKRMFGVFAYGLAALIPILRDKPFELYAKSADKELKIHTRQVLVSSGRYFGWQPVTPQAGVRSGDLAFFATEENSPLQTVVTDAALLLGRQTKLQNAHFFCASTITIKTKPKQPLNVDGHALGTTPAKFSVARNALRVLVPQTFEDEA